MREFEYLRVRAWFYVQKRDSHTESVRLDRSDLIHNHMLFSGYWWSVELESWFVVADRWDDFSIISSVIYKLNCLGAHLEKSFDFCLIKCCSPNVWFKNYFSMTQWGAHMFHLGFLFCICVVAMDFAVTLTVGDLKVTQLKNSHEAYVTYFNMII